jgi:spore maturation protein CgeB
MVLTYGGGDPVVNAYKACGARACVPIYNALDPDTHFPVRPKPHFAADLGLLANRLPDREARVDEFFFGVARMLPRRRFLLGGNGWSDKGRPANVAYAGHVFTRDHNAFNCSPLAVLNVSRDSMARYGYSPATRVFEAAGAGACLITDRWEGIDTFFEPDREILVAADGSDVAEHVRRLSAEQAATIGRAAMRRALADHTYTRRAQQLDALLALQHAA